MNSTSRGDAGGAPTGPGGGAAAGAGFEGKSYFETQREAMCHEIGLSLETVLQNMNKLNRALEGVIAVGNEFASVEALWSQFETVMGQGHGAGGGGGAVDPNEEEQELEEDEDERDEDREGDEADVD